jgi:hypothetical protein
MGKKDKPEASPESEEVIMERTKVALRRALSTPHETHKEMVERRRGRSPTKRRQDKQV